MSSVTKQIVEMIDMLPESEQKLACELLKRLVQAWDPDFTKLTPAEASRLAKSKKDIANGELVSHNEVDWN